MAFGLTLILTQLGIGSVKIWTPEQWAKRPGTVPGDKALWPKGAVPDTRRARRHGADVWVKPVRKARKKVA